MRSKPVLQASANSFRLILEYDYINARKNPPCPSQMVVTGWGEYLFMVGYRFAHHVEVGFWHTLLLPV